jgi:hypothetical protein
MFADNSPSQRGLGGQGAPLHGLVQASFLRASLLQTFFSQTFFLFLLLLLLQASFLAALLLQETFFLAGLSLQSSDFSFAQCCCVALSQVGTVSTNVYQKNAISVRGGH